MFIIFHVEDGALPDLRTCAAPSRRQVFGAPQQGMVAATPRLRETPSASVTGETKGATCRTQWPRSNAPSVRHQTAASPGGTDSRCQPKELRWRISLGRQAASVLLGQWYFFARNAVQWLHRAWSHGPIVGSSESQANEPDLSECGWVI